MVRDKLLAMLVCPDDRTPLKPADAQLLERVNRAIAAGQIKNRAGAKVEEPLEAALVRQDGQMLYAVIDDIPNMLIDESISLASLDDA